MENNIKKIKIQNTDIFLEDFGDGKGKITISDTYGHNYSTYWGSMKDSLEEFICSTNSEYFANRLMGSESNYEMDVPATFANIRKYIREEIGLAWYQHLEFQKDMREKLSDFQRQCEDIPSAQYFVDNFDRSFVNDLYFYSIDDRWKREDLESEFKAIDEVWNFIAEKKNRKYLWLEQLHAELKKHIRTQEKQSNNIAI